MKNSKKNKAFAKLSGAKRSNFFIHDAWNTFKNLKIKEILSAQDPNLTAYCQGPQYSKKRSFPKK